MNTVNAQQQPVYAPPPPQQYAPPPPPAAAPAQEEDVISQPAGPLIWAVAGGAIGGILGKHMGRAIPADDLKQLAAQMQPNTSAILAMVEDVATEQVIGDLQGYNAQVVTLTMGSEVSGEVAQAVAAEVDAPAAGDKAAAEAKSYA